MQKVTDALFSLKEATASFAPQGFVTKCFLIFIVDKVKNFAANIFFQLVIKSHTRIRAIDQSRTGIRASKGGVHILKSSEVLKWQKVSAVSLSTGLQSLGTKVCTRSETSLYYSELLFEKVSPQVFFFL